jgi:hypothetical protein
MYRKSFRIPASCGCQATVLIGVRNDVLPIMVRSSCQLQGIKEADVEEPKHLWTSAVPIIERATLAFQGRTGWQC